MKSWKTTLAGAIVLLTGVAVTMKWITSDVATAVITIAGALGLVAAKDSNVTGGSTPQ